MDPDLLRRRHDFSIDDNMVEDARRRSLLRRGLLSDPNDEGTSDGRINLF